MRVSRDFRFEAAHRLEEYRGGSEPIHGHSWKLRVALSSHVGADGLAFDFLELERIVNEKVIDLLDHTCLNDTVNPPSAEKIALWVWGRLDTLPLAEVTVWETEDCAVTYDGKE